MLPLLLRSEVIPIEEPVYNSSSPFLRVLSARVFHNNNWTVGDRTAEEVGEVLAQLQPTYISGLIYLDDRIELKEKHIEAYQKIRAKVLAQSPDCKFDFTINPRQFDKPEDIIARMQSIDEQLDIDIWYLDFIEARNKAKSKIIEAAVSYAHSQGQLIGGNELEPSLLKQGDFVAFHDGQSINLDMKDDMAKLLEDYDIKILFQINNDSGRSTDDTVHTFIKKWDKSKRIAHVKRLAKNQYSWEYRLMYPIFFPVYLKQYSYDAGVDDDILETYQELIENYNQED